MATVTPNFNWPVPTSTDLVKDGATAIEALGDSIDASLVDLKGGTSGQVLSKNSNTDMDFVWVTSDDANAIQNTIVDAKGDLITATAADTPARLAVGANNLYLVADSSAATGLKYEGAITSWTPTFSGLTTGNATVIAEYQRVGNLVFCYVDVTLGSTSAVTGDVNFTLPTGTSKRGKFTGNSYYVDAGVATAGGSMETFGGNAYFRVTNTSGTWANVAWDLSSTRPWTWGTGDQMLAYFYYEVA
jgi:hypothetical protein